jgi:dihydroxyacetone kinase-like predicted kinase
MRRKVEKPVNNARWDGLLLKRLINAGTDWVGEHVSQLNAIDVYPIPVRMAGTNIYLTLRAACSELNSCSSDSASDMAKAAARGALMGARGHQGVPFAAWLRGIAKSFESKRSISAHDFAQAMAEAADYAYRSEVKPVEGTMLTVAREAAQGAARAATKRADIRYVLQEAIADAKRSVALTRFLIPTLREAAVVHAGGLALAIFLEGMERDLAGLPTQIDFEADTQVESYRVELARLSKIKGTDIQRWIYEAATTVQLLVCKETQDVEICGGAIRVRRLIHDAILAYGLDEYLLDEIRELMKQLRGVNAPVSLLLVKELYETLRDEVF